MDNYFKGTLWMIIGLFTLPHVICSINCPRICTCKKGSVACDGSHVIDIPEGLPDDTSMLGLNGTKIQVIYDRSLAHNKFLQRFSLTHSHLHTIHPGAFTKAAQIESVKLTSNDLSNLPAGVFSPLTDLEQLYLDSNQFQTIAADMFQGLVKLQSLDLKKNKLSILAPDAFKELAHLQFLNLGSNLLKKLPSTIFQSLTELRVLILYYNELQELEAGIFDGLVNLHTLKMQHNHITRLAPWVFWSLRNLRTLTLSTNRLQSIPEKTFYYMPKLSELTIFNNPFIFLPDQLMGHMPLIKVFYLHYTNLNTVPGNLFANLSGLTTLNLHFNDKLVVLPSDLFCCLPHLVKLSLKSNKLVNLHPELFSKLTTLNKLFLNDNKLQSLPENIFQGLDRLNELWLSGNPWDCTCSIRGLLKWIRHKEYIVHDGNEVICHSPEYRQNRALGSLRDEEFDFCDATSASPTFAQRTTWATSQVPTENNIVPTPATSCHTTPPSAVHTTFLTTTLKTTTIPIPNEEPNPITETASTGYPSPAFYKKLVMEQGPEFVHHHRHNSWVYVWFLPSDSTLVGLLMFSHILLVATGLFLILATMYFMHRLNKTMEELNVAECDLNAK